VVENLKAAVEALQSRLTVQEQTNVSLALANDKLVGEVEALRKVDSHEEERRVAKSRRQSGDKVTKGKSARKDEQANAVSSSSSDDSASGSNPTSSDDDKSNATDTSSSDDGHQGLSGNAFWSVIGYGYTPVLRI